MNELLNNLERWWHERWHSHGNVEHTADEHGPDYAPWNERYDFIVECECGKIWYYE